MANLTLIDNQFCPLTVQAVDAANNPAPLPAGAVSWTSSNEAVVGVIPDPDGLGCRVTTMGPLGVAQVAVSVVVDDVTTLTGSLDVTVVAGAAATIQIVPGTPAAK